MGDKDFFLSPDDAMTMGDINYMRSSRRTKRTFPKTLKNKDGFAIENEVSSLQARNNFSQGSSTNQNASVNTVFNPTPSSQSQPGVTGGSVVPQSNQAQAQTNIQQPNGTSQSSEKRRPADNSMDMFRNMAKNIRKR